jgi:hypothetical protein
MNGRIFRNLAVVAMMASWLMLSPPKAGACDVPCENGCVIDENDCIDGCYLLPPLQQSGCLENCSSQYNACLRACGC